MATTGSGPLAQPLPPTELSLTGVTVSFLAARPKTKVKLTIKLGGNDYSVEVGKGGSVEWSGKIRGTEGSKIIIQVHRRSRLHYWQEFACAEGSLTKFPLSGFDAERKIKVTLAISVLTNPEPRFSDAVLALPAAKIVVEQKIVIAERLRKIFDVLKFIDNIGETIKGIHPAASIAMGAVSSLIKLCEKQETCRDEAADLVEHLMSFTSVKSYEEKLKKREETRQAVHVMLVLITEASDYIRTKTRTGIDGVIGDLIGSEYKAEITKLQRRFTRAKESFDRSVQLEIFAAVDGIALDTQLSILDSSLLPCKDAHFRPGDGCLDGTRTDLRQRALSWLNNDTSYPNVFWLFGNAGSGKSTVANTVAKMVDPDRGFQLSCFFCKRDDPNLSNPQRLLPTLAYRLAQQHESYRALVLDLIRDGVRGAGLATTADIETQFNRLFKEPLAKTLEPARPHVVVVDGLDECGTPKDRMKLAATILALSRAVPWIKIFVTSRDEPDIRKIFSEAPDCVSYSINNGAGVDADIRLYIASEADALDIRLSESDVRKLVRRAEGLFIWCRTLFEYLRGGLDPRSLLDDVLSGEADEGHSDPPEPWGELYGLYDKILGSAPGHREEDASFMRTILSVVNAAASNRPLSAKAIMSFLHGQKLHKRYSAESAAKVVKRLHAVLYEDAAAGGGVRAHHTSFYDFLARKASGTGTETGWMTAEGIHQLMAHACLKILHEELKFNICEIEIPVLNKNVLDLATRVSARISEELQYSSRYWFTHVSSRALAIPEVQRAILELLRSKKVLFWFECMSLLGSLERIRSTFRKSMKASAQDHPAITAAVEDTCRFANSFADCMESIPHIYMSALWWLPENSLMYQSLGLSKRTHWHLITNKRKSWGALVWKSDQFQAYSVTFSPDGRLIACGAADGAIYIRDAQTGTQVGEPLRGHQRAVRSIAFSPDSQVIVSGSEDSTVQIWDAKSGETIFGPLGGHSDIVNCVAFSPDGLCVASASYDHTIRIWNTGTGEPQGEPLWHPDGVDGVAYSPDGHFVASACSDGCVHVWGVASRHEAMEPFQSHRKLARAVAYSPDGRTIVSGAGDKTIRVWDARTGQSIGEPLRGHTSVASSAAYSPDGRFILTGAHDGTVRLWDAVSHSAIGEPLETHSGTVWGASYSPDGTLVACASHGGVYVWDASTAFVAGSQPQHPTRQEHRAVCAAAYSPDGRFIASGSRHSGQIRLWDAQTGAPEDAPLLTHAGMTQQGSVQSIAYSRDGRHIASGSDDGDNSSVCVLNAQTGALVVGPLRGHFDTIHSMAYSPDGDCVASASADGTVRLWSVQTGAPIGDPLHVGAPALSVALSHDGRLLACSTGDGTIWIWDTRTRAPLRDPIQAHAEWARAVVFSPDGRHIASGSDDGSVRIWDAQTGEACGGPLRGHQSLVVCVAYAPDGRFVASGSDGEVIVWDVQTGLACGEPLRGPSDWINSVAYSPDGCFLASGTDDGSVYVHHAPNDRGGVEARWLDSCSRMDPRDGWIKEDETLVLWAPAPYREHIRRCARVIIPNPTPNITAYSIEYRTVFRYLGRDWTDIMSDFDE